MEDEPLFCERVAGIDIGKKEILVTIRVPGDSGSGRRQQETRDFGTTRSQLLALADWLRCWQVAKAGMEAAGGYWKPVYFLLEREGFGCDLYHASQVRALPGESVRDFVQGVVESSVSAGHRGWPRSWGGQDVDARGSGGGSRGPGGGMFGGARGG